MTKFIDAHDSGSQMKTKRPSDTSKLIETYNPADINKSSNAARAQHASASFHSAKT